MTPRSPGLSKCKAFQSTAILRLPTPRKPPKSITAARTRPLWSTTTSTIRPIFSSAAPSTCRPRMPSTSWLFSTVTDGGSAVPVEEGPPVAGLGVSSGAADKATRAVNKAATSPNFISLLACIYVPMELHSDKPNGVGRFRSLVPTAERGLLPRFSALRLRGKHNRNADVAADPRRIERYGLAVAPHAQVDARGGKLQVAQHDLVQEFRQPRIAQPDLAVERVEFEPKASFEERERRGAGPGLRRARDRIKRRAVAALALKAAKQFGQPPLVHIGRGAEQSSEQSLDRTLGLVTRHAERDQRVVVWPDRTVMVRHRIKTGLAAGHGTDAPAREKIRLQ